MDNNCHNLIKQYLDYCDQNQIDIVRYDANEEYRSLRSNRFMNSPARYVYLACKINSSGFYETANIPSNISCKDDFDVGDILSYYIKNNDDSYEVDKETYNKINVLSRSYSTGGSSYVPLVMNYVGNTILDVSVNKILINKDIFKDFKTQEDYKCYYDYGFVADYVELDASGVYATSSKIIDVDGEKGIHPCIFGINTTAPIQDRPTAVLIDRAKVDELFEFLKKEKEEVECQSHEFNTIIEHHQKIIKENKSKVTKIKNKSKKEIKKYIDSIKI